MRNILLPLLLLISSWLQAQHKGDHTSVDIRSNTVCDMCKKTIETEMLYVKGVKAVTVDLATSSIHVDYDERKTDPVKLRTAVAKLGYAADELPPDMKAREELPECCKAEGCGMPAGQH